ncbi:8833_t:CDS:1, partial [Gigaspora margarita]
NDEINDLLALDREVIQNIECAENGRVAISEVGECMNVVEAIETEYLITYLSLEELFTQTSYLDTENISHE